MIKLADNKITDIYGNPITKITMLRNDRVALRISGGLPLIYATGVTLRSYCIADNDDALLPLEIDPPEWSDFVATNDAHLALMNAHDTDNYLIVILSGETAGDFLLTVGDKNIQVEIIDQERVDMLGTLFGTGAMFLKTGPLKFHGIGGYADGIDLGLMYTEDMINGWGIGPYTPAMPFAMRTGQADVATTLRRSFQYSTGKFEPPQSVTDIFVRYAAKLPQMMIQHIGRLVWSNPSKFMFGGQTMDDKGWEGEATRFYKAMADWARENRIEPNRLVIMIDEPPISYKQICKDEKPACWSLKNGGGQPMKRMAKLIRVATAAGFRVGPTTLGGVSLKLFRDLVPATNQYWFAVDTSKKKYWNSFWPERDIATSKEHFGIYHVAFDGYRPGGNPANIWQLGLTAYAGNLNSLLYWSVLNFAYPNYTENVWGKPLPPWALNLYWPPCGTEMAKGKIGYMVPSIRLAYLNGAVRLNTLCRLAEQTVGRDAVLEIIGGTIGPELVWEWSQDVEDYAGVEQALMDAISGDAPPPPEPPPPSPEKTLAEWMAATDARVAALEEAAATDREKLRLLLAGLRKTLNEING